MIRTKKPKKHASSYGGKYYYYSSYDKNIWSSFHDFSHLFVLTRSITQEQAFKLAKKLNKTINGEG